MSRISSRARSRLPRAVNQHHSPDEGRCDAGKAGAPNITVILDRRYSARKDVNGRFDFPAVAAGHHVLSLQSDNLPLPWQLTNSGRTEVQLTTRGSTEVDSGAQRLK